MTPPTANKVLVLLAGTLLAAGTTAHLRAVAATPGAPAQEGAQEGGQQEPDEQFRLTDRQRFGEEGQAVGVGNSRFLFGSIFEFTDRVNDLFVWAWMPTIAGEIADNAFLGGQRVQITADSTIGGDLFIFAQTGRIDGTVGGDIYAFVAEMTIARSGRVGGALNGSSGTLVIDGEVDGPLSFAGGVVTINGTVRDDARIEAGELEIGPDAVILGELRYQSPREATIDSSARIDGDIRYFAPRDEEEGESSPAASVSRFSLWSVLWDVWWLVSSFLVGVIALALGGDKARRPAERLVQQPALGLGFGFVIAVVIPAAAILAIVLLVTIPLGLITVAVYLAAAYLARLVAAQAVGDALLGQLRGGRPASPYAALAIGLLLFYALTRIPYVGFLIWLAAVVGGLGGIFLATRKTVAVGPGETVAASPIE